MAGPHPRRGKCTKRHKDLGNDVDGCNQYGPLRDSDMCACCGCHKFFHVEIQGLEVVKVAPDVEVIPDPDVGVAPDVGDSSQNDEEVSFVLLPRLYGILVW